MALAHSPKIVTDGLVYHFDANDVKSAGIGTSTWKNRTGSGNLDKSNLTEGDGVFSYNGDTSYTDLGSNYTLDKDASSIGGWFKIIDFTNIKPVFMNRKNVYFNTIFYHSIQ